MLKIFRGNKSVLLKRLGIRPDKASEWTGHVEMSWFSGKEFAGILDKTKSFGTVIPADTLRVIQGKPLEVLVDAMKVKIDLYMIASCISVFSKLFVPH